MFAPGWRAAEFFAHLKCEADAGRNNSGMNLLGLPQGTRFVITGLVLLGAVLVDALSKRARAARGLA